MPLTETRAFLAQDVGQPWGPDLSDAQKAFVVDLDKRAKEAGFLAVSFEPMDDDSGDWIVEASRRSVKARPGKKMVVRGFVTVVMLADEGAAETFCRLLDITYQGVEDG